MKNVLIRIMAIAIFATSISAFAASGKARASEDPNANSATSEAKTAPSAAAQQNDGAQTCASPSEDSKEKTQRQKLIEQENQQWLHDTQYSSGL